MSKITIKTAQKLEEERIESLANQVRAKRDSLLKECDYVFMPDYPIQKELEWRQYRIALRNITKQSGFPETIAWPVKPDTSN